MLAEVGLLREAASEAHELLAGSDASQSVEGLGASDLVGLAVARLSSHEVFAPFVEPLRNAQAELEDVVAGLRHQEEGLEEDPERLEALRRRLQLFSELRRKYGPSLGDVVEFAEAKRAQLAELEAADLVSALMLEGSFRSHYHWSPPHDDSPRYSGSFRRICPPYRDRRLLFPSMAWAAADGDDPTKVLTEKSTDSRLGPVKTLNDYFPFAVPKTKEAWEARRKQVREQLLVATGLWPLPEKRR